MESYAVFPLEGLSVLLIKYVERLLNNQELTFTEDALDHPLFKNLIALGLLEITGWENSFNRNWGDIRATPAGLRCMLINRKYIRIPVEYEK